MPCGSPSAGACDQPHATPSCSDAACCNTVCAFVPACCSVAWDTLCVTIADGNCATQCTPSCPTGSIVEGEICGTQSNGACVGGAQNATLLAVGNGQAVCGRLQQINDGSPDLDGYRINLPDPNGDGIARLTVQYTAEYATDSKSFVALLPTACTPLASAIHVLQMNSCGVQAFSACVPAGTWIAVVGRGTFPNPQVYPYGCGGLQSYSLGVSWNDQCTNPCGTAGSCYEPHASAGCEIAACCSSVCAVDPVCCEKSWDQLCADRALMLCPPPTPANDLCQNARIVHLGNTPFTLVGATATSYPAPSGCLAGGGTLLGADVWFRLTDVEGTVALSTCGVGVLDSVIVVYDQQCATTVVACNDDAATCPTNQLSSQVEFAATCGGEYFIRMAAIPGHTGSGTLRVTASLPPCAPCPDVNDDNQVDGVDLSAVLAGWGTGGGGGGGDIDGDGSVNGTDLTAILAGWGPCPN
ncbi:MAG: hypothetical protein EXS17_05345 [Phycisphaerales bacterium]|nr:hypothetical protein [Phycisphaerales bacterium]